MKNMVLETYKADTVIYCPPNSVKVIIEGCLLMQSHLDDLVKPKTIATLFAGDVIGCADLDRGFSGSQDTWLITCSQNKKTVLAVFDQ
jgi:hypothetical protein